MKNLTEIIGSNISIHASAKEATDDFEYFVGDAIISIHASAKEATRMRICSCRLCLYFNPRLREGGDDYLLNSFAALRISIHASAKEATLIHFFIRPLTSYFNPRLREGGDTDANM